VELVPFPVNFLMMVCRFRKRFVFAEPKFGFEAVDPSLIPPRPRKY
jgi:hypothetical protein